MICGIYPWFPILSIKFLDYALVFQNAFIDSIIEQAALKTRKLFLFQLLHVKLDLNPLSLHVTYILSLYFALFFFVCYFLSWIMSRSLTSQIITITTKSDNVIFCWELIKVYLLFSRKTCGAETVECFFVLLECSSLPLSALQQNRAQSRLLYFFYDKESVKFPSYCFLFCKTNLIFTANQSVISVL